MIVLAATMLVVLLVNAISADQILMRPKRQGENQPPSTCPQLIPGPPGAPGGLSYREAKELKQDITEELQETIESWKENQTMLFRGHGISHCLPSLGKSEKTAAMSCKEITECSPLAPSGKYWLKTDTIKEVYCDLETWHCGQRGWLRIAYINMTEQEARCPVPLRQISSPKKLCGRSTTGGGCSSVTFHSFGFRYNHVCGQARGYQYYSTNAFKQVQTDINDINLYYVDGISITYGSPRRHLWTYTSGLSEDDNTQENGDYNCPCAKYPGEAPPAFVGSDYYCESAFTGNYNPTQHRKIALEDPLWDGEGCSRGSGCCDRAGMPWFCRTLPQQVHEDIEVRLCSDEAYTNEDNYLELIEVYVK